MWKLLTLGVEVLGVATAAVGLFLLAGLAWMLIAVGVVAVVAGEVHG